MEYPLTRHIVEEHFGGNSESRYRVWVAPRPDALAYYYVASVTEAVDVMDEYAEGALGAGFEENDERNGWITWLDDRGCDIADLLDERDDDPEHWSAE